MTHPLVKLISNEATFTPTWKPWPWCQRQAPLPTKTQALQWGNKTKHIPTWWTPERSCPSAPHWTETLSQIQAGHIQAKRTLISYVHTQITHSKSFPQHIWTGKYSPKLSALSTLHICLVLSAVRKRWQNRLTGHLYRLSRPHPS